MLTQRDKDCLRMAVDSAAVSLDDGDGPFGCIIADGKRILGSARNSTVAESNPTAHAEMIAIREACRVFKAENLASSTAYCSCEPCPMCLAALFYAGVTRVVFAATLEDARGFGSGDPLVDADWLNRQAKLGLELIAGPERERAKALFAQYVEKFGHL